MMICNADFEELFPDLLQPELVPAIQRRAKAPSAECIARWEDDGGRNDVPAPPTRTAQVRNPVFAYDMDRFVGAGAIIAAAPAIATFATASTMLSNYGEMTTRQDVTF